MDVVRRSIESLKGRIDIKSELGKGTTFYLKLPLTLAITDGMPKAAVEAGAVEKIVRLADVAPWLMSAASPTRRAG